MLNSISDRLEHIRSDMKLTQIKFSDLLGISRGAYQNYKNESRSLPAYVIAKLVIDHGVDARWLLTGHVKVITDFDGQLITDCMMLRSLIDQRLAETNSSIPDNKKGDIIKILLQARQTKGDYSRYDRDLMIQLITTYVSEAA